MVLVQDTDHFYRKMELPIVTISGLRKKLFSCVGTTQKDANTVITKSQTYLDVGSFFVQSSCLFVVCCHPIYSGRRTTPFGQYVDAPARAT